MFCHFFSTVPELPHTVHVSNTAEVSLCLQLNTVRFHMVSHLYRFLMTLLDTYGVMPKHGNQDLRSHRDISSSLGFESLDGILVIIRRMQFGGNPSFNPEQMSSNKMPLGLSFVFGCILVEWAFKFEVIFFEVDYRMSVQICFVLSGQWMANSSKIQFIECSQHTPSQLQKPYR